MKRKKYIITAAMATGKDELWCRWYTCPACAESVTYGHRFCSGCGVKLVFDESAKELEANQ